MPFASSIGAMPIIDDTNWQNHVDEADANPDKYGRGMRPRKDQYGTLGFAAPINFPLIPRSEWEPRIKDMEKTKSRLSDLCVLKRVKIKNQSNTNYCWINAPTTALEICRVQQGQKYVELSPASAGAIIKGYRNVGGWGTEANKFLSTTGCVPVSQWPANHWHTNQYDTPETKALRKKYMVLEWWDLKPRSLDEFITCLLLRIPVPIGLNWWGHEVLGEDPLWIDGAIACSIRNSWGTSWGDQGRGVLRGGKMLPDDAVAPRSVMAA